MDILGSENINESLQTHFLIYKITNTANSKYYIGQHKTKDPYDDYMGSGKLILKALKKYDLSSFTKEILFDFDNFEEMNNKEKELVQLSNCWPLDKNSYNLQQGGYAGIRSDISNKKISNAQKLIWQNKSDEQKKQWSEARHKSMLSNSNAMRGHKIQDFMNEDEIKQWKLKLSAASKKQWKDLTYRNKVLSKTIQNPNVSHDVRKYMSKEQIKKWKENIGNSCRGEKNGMYGKSSWEKCTAEQRENRIQRFKKNMKGKNKGKRCMKLPNESKWKYIKAEEVQKYLDLGYEFYSQNKGKKFKSK